MIRRLMLIFITILTSNFLWAQQNKLEIKGTQNDIYLDHTIAPKETFYSVGRMYNVSTKELATFNQLQLAAPLNVGQVLRVPLTRANFSQTGGQANAQAMIPVYHTVQPGETLYRLGENYNKVPVASLKQWNHLQSNEISVETPMIVGFLKVDKTKSALANARGSTQEPMPAKNKTDEIATAVPAVNAAAPEVTKDASTDKPAAAAMTSANTSNKADPGFSGGYFKNLYNQQTANKSMVDNNGVAGVFKSTSGWQDGKYYCFNNNVGAGTVLKITNSTTGKSVYAKVLDAIPDIKQNEGLSVILSNAASAELGSGESNFACAVSFGK